MNQSGFQLNYLIFGLGGDRTYLDNLIYGETWTGDNRYDWSTFDKEFERIARLAPQSKIIVKVVLDGARWWTAKYPEDAAYVTRGIPEYLNERWNKDSREALRQMVAHIQTSPYANMVIGYTLFNGPSLDCNWRPNPATPLLQKKFRDFLRKKYGTVDKLREAWRDSMVEFETATVSMDKSHSNPDSFPLLNCQ